MFRGESSGAGEAAYPDYLTRAKPTKGPPCTSWAVWSDIWCADPLRPFRRHHPLTSLPLPPTPATMERTDSLPADPSLPAQPLPPTLDPVPAGSSPPERTLSKVLNSLRPAELLDAFAKLPTASSDLFIACAWPAVERKEEARVVAN